MDAHRIATFAGGLVQRVLGMVEQARGIAGVLRAQAHAQLAGHEQRIGQYRKGQLHLLADLFGEILGQGQIGGARHGNQELIAAMPPQHAASAQVGLQALGDQHQCLVTDLRAHVLVDRGEVVDVHMHQHQRGASGSGFGDHRLQLGVAGAKAIRRIIDADRGQVGVPHGLSIPLTRRPP
ncbi:hypothetical protein D3C72_1870360 [compost metagenome]